MTLIKDHGNGLVTVESPAKGGSNDARPFRWRVRKEDWENHDLRAMEQYVMQDMKTLSPRGCPMPYDPDGPGQSTPIYSTQAYERLKWEDGTSLDVYRGHFSPETEARIVGEVKAIFEDYKKVAPATVTTGHWQYKPWPAAGFSMFQVLTAGALAKDGPTDDHN